MNDPEYPIPHEEIEKAAMSEIDERHMQQHGYVMKSFDGKIVVDFIEGDSVTFDTDPGNGLDGLNPRELTGREAYTPARPEPTVIEYTAKDVADTALALVHEHWHGPEKSHHGKLEWGKAIRQRPEQVEGAVEYTYKWMKEEAQSGKDDLTAARNPNPHDRDTYGILPAKDADMERPAVLKFPTKNQVDNYIQKQARPTQPQKPDRNQTMQRQQRQAAATHPREAALNLGR